jgi:Holliday junction resolvasome RuvABC endonuclease subunit
MALFLGCDPGANGAICILNPRNQSTHFFSVPGGKTSPGVLFRALQTWIDIYEEPDKVAIEDVHSLYGMSAKSNFSFGSNVGSAFMLLACLMPDKYIQRIQPKAWQQKVGITAKGKAIKKAVALRAHQLYPDAELYGPKGGLLDGRADALMIAHYLTLQE